MLWLVEADESEESEGTGDGVRELQVFEDDDDIAVAEEFEATPF